MLNITEAVGSMSNTDTFDIISISILIAIMVSIKNVHQRPHMLLEKIGPRGRCGLTSSSGVGSGRKRQVPGVMTRKHLSVSLAPPLSLSLWPP